MFSLLSLNPWSLITRSIQTARMIRVVIRSNNPGEEDSFVTVPSNILHHSEVANEKSTARGHEECEQIEFSYEEDIAMSEFMNFVHFLYTGTIETTGPLTLGDLTNEEAVSDRVYTWVNGYCVGHRVRADGFMNHCLGVAMSLHCKRPNGLGVKVGSLILYLVLPRLQQREDADMYEFLVGCIAREWKYDVLGEKEERIAEWDHTFKDWPEFAASVKAKYRQD
jgi:hypothetical protein